MSPGERFSFDLNLFDMSQHMIAYLVLAFVQLARQRLGPGRGRADLVEVTQLGERGEFVSQIYDGGSAVLREPAPPLKLSLTPGPERIERVRVRFVTPTELKAGHRLAERPEFGVLAARVRDRVSTLRTLYGGGPLAIDFQRVRGTGGTSANDALRVGAGRRGAPKQPDGTGPLDRRVRGGGRV